jgi:hypothetical protein
MEMSERRYRDGEVREILEVAARQDLEHSEPATLAEGLTLSEIQSIASEVGISADTVSRAAAGLDLVATKRRTSWGMPIEVARSIPLARPPTDEEWERLVAELRSTFGTRGRVAVLGNLKEWSNGNLYASLESTDRGYRLRMATLKSGAEAINALGMTGIAAGAAVAGATAIAGGTPEIAGSLVLGLMGAAAILANMIRLPHWARLRDRQMGAIEASVRAMVEIPADRLSNPVTHEEASWSV